MNRRELLITISAAALAGPLSAEAAQHVHEAATEAAATTSGVYSPKALNPHEYQTLTLLCEMIVPGAAKGGAAPFVDLLSSQNPDMLDIYTGGLAWLDRAMARQYNAGFLAATPAQRTAMLDIIAYRRNSTPELAAGIHFFDWARHMTVDAYYTSAAGIKEVGYMGNGAQSQFHVPPEAIDYAVKRSGLA